MDTPTQGSAKPSHRWKFFRAGGVDQVTIERSSDLAALSRLDQKLWVALSCPTRGLDLDAKTLDLVDTDHDGHIRAPEILAAVAWVVTVLKDPIGIAKGSDSLPLAAITQDTPEGARLLASARRILASLGKGDSNVITLEDTGDTTRIFSKTPFNGDGIIPPESVESPAARAIVGEIIACVGGDTDRSGAVGVTQARVDRFFAALRAHDDWWREAEADRAAILFLGEATPAAFEALRAVRGKVEDYFVRCRMAAFDPRAAEALNPPESDFRALSSKEFSPAAAEAAGFPIARVEAGKPLPLVEGINPAWAAPLETFRQTVLLPILRPGTTALTPEEWTRANSRFAPYEAWLARRKGPEVEKLGLARVREILTGDAQAVLTAAIAQDLSLAAEMNEIVAVERLVRYHRDLHRLLCNFVSFRDFYSRRRAVFQAGTLYLDGRSCDLCVRVEDPARHSALAGLSKTYLAYCDCARRGTPEKMQIAAAFTAGDSDHLMAGRNGIFYDRLGQDWDATITQVVENPISIWQAVVSPYKRIGRMINEQIQKASAARQQAAQQRAAALAAQPIGAPGTPPAPAAPQPQAQPHDIGKTVGILAAVGLALGFISSAAASIFFHFVALAWWQMPLAILGVFVVISGASVIMAALKLRQRNLGPILDANAWAVNGRVRINIPFGAALTRTARLPSGSIRLMNDPYASRKGKFTFWISLAALVVIVLAYNLLVRYRVTHWPF